MAVKRKNRPQPSEVLKQAFNSLEGTPIINIMKASGEYERLLRTLKLPPMPTRASRVM